MNESVRQALLNVQSVSALLDLIASSPELPLEECARWLAESAAARPDDARLQAALGDRATILRMCAESGIEKMQQDFEHEVTRILHQLLSAPTWLEKREVIGRWPAIFRDPAVVRSARAWAARAWAEGQPAATYQLAQHAALLARLQDGQFDAIDAGFSGAVHDCATGELREAITALEAVAGGESGPDEIAAALDRLMAAVAPDAAHPAQLQHTLRRAVEVAAPWPELVPRARTAAEMATWQIAADAVHAVLALQAKASTALVAPVRFDPGRDLAYLSSALDDVSTALAMIPDDEAARVTLLDCLGRLLAMRGSVLQQPNDLDTAVRRLLDAEALDPDTERLLLIVSLLEQQRTRSPAAATALADEVAQALDAALQRGPGRRERIACLLALASVCEWMRDLNRAIALATEAFDLAGPLPDFDPGSFVDLRAAWRWRAAGGRQGIRGASRSAAHESDPALATALALLGRLAVTRAMSTHSLRDLDWGVECLRRVVSLLSPGDRRLASAHNDLGSTLVLRLSMRDDRSDDLLEALQHHLRAVEYPAETELEHGAHLVNLAFALLQRNEGDDAAEAARALAEADSRLPPEGALRARWAGVCARAALAAREPDPEALSRARQALLQCDLTNLEQRDRVNHLVTTAEIEQALVRLNRSDPESVSARFQQALAAAISPRQALVIVWHWGDWAEAHGRPDDAIDAWRRVAAPLGALLEAQLRWDDRLQDIKGIIGVADAAASRLAACGFASEALQIVESARACLLGRELAFRRADLSPLGGLDEGPPIVERHQRLAALLSTANAVARAPFGSVELPDIEQLEGDLRAHLQDIRRFPGMGTCGTPPDATALMSSLDTTTVYPVIGHHVSVALLVSRGDISVVALPGVSRRQMSALRGEYLRSQVHGGAVQYKALREVTGRLWSLLMSPITTRLDAGSTVTIVSGGLLAGLPLHAAWRPDGARRRYVLDDYCVRYVPNMQIAMAAAAMLRAAAPPGSILIVQDPRPVPADPLRHARSECIAAAHAFPRHTVLAAEEATANHLRTELPRHDVVHLACHGWSDWKDPLDSGLLLAGGAITARELNIVSLDSRLVVVSACESGHPGAVVADEPLGLPAALMELGAAAVIASSWKVNDASTFELFTRFYDRWPSTHSASEALRLAQREVRDTTVGDKRAYLSARLGRYVEPWPFHADADVPYADPYYWAAFTYTGV